MNSDVSAPPPGGFFLGFSDEVDAAFGAGGDWRRDPDGVDGDAGTVTRKKRVLQARLIRRFSSDIVPKDWNLCGPRSCRLSICAVDDDVIPIVNGSF